MKSYVRCVKIFCARRFEVIVVSNTFLKNKICEVCGNPLENANVDQARKYFETHNVPFYLKQHLVDDQKSDNPPKKKIKKDSNNKTLTSLGIETTEGFAEIIKKGTILPAKISKIFSTAEDNQTIIAIRVLSGNSKERTKNELIEDFQVDKIPRSPRGVPQIEVTFAIDKNANVNITSKNLGRYEKSQPTGTGFWTGAEGLAKTFWLYFIVGNMFGNLLRLVVASVPLENIYLIYFVVVLQVVWNIFAVMGVFNAADIYKAKKIEIGVSYGYATAAKIICVVLIMSGIGNLLSFFRS